MEIREVFEKQKETSQQLRSEPIKKRIERLKAIKRWVYANREEIRDAIYKDLKKPPEEADITEIYVVIREVKKAIKNLKNWIIPEPEGTSLAFLGTSAEVYYEPKGRTLIIAPWNYPFSLCMSPLVSAIAAGNTAIVKPSEMSVHTANIIDKMCSELFGDEMIKVFNGGIETSTELLSLPFDHIFFTGSPRVGKIVMAAASKHLTSVTLELGGKSPCLVDKSANIQDTAQKVAWGKWTNAGQTCVAPDYIFVHEKIKDQFVDKLKREAEKMFSTEQSYASIIDDGHFKRLKDWKSESLDSGAKLLYEGSSNEESRRMAPCILEETKEGTHLNDNEIFGPICVIKTFADLDDAIDQVNKRPKALASYIFANDRKVVERMKQETSAGSFVINDNVLQFGHPSLPFGGVNNSGMGKSHGKYGFIEFSNQKSVLKQRVGFTMAKILYPPYNNFKRLNIDFLLKYF